MIKITRVWFAIYMLYVLLLNINYYQGRSHRGGHGGRVPRAPYYVPLHQNDNRQFVFGADLTSDMALYYSV